MRCLSFVLLSLALLPASVTAQTASGCSQSVCTVSVTGTPTIGEMYIADRQTNTAYQLTLSKALAAERVNCVTMLSATQGYVGTNSPITSPVMPSDIYWIDINGTVVTETRVNTTPCAGPNLAQFAIIGSRLYFTTQDATNAPGSGVLQSVPTTGGPVTIVADLSTLPGWVGGNGGANCIAAVNGKLYVASFDSTTTPASDGCVVEHDPAGPTTKVLLRLPGGKGPAGAAFFNTGICSARGAAGKLHLFGIFGDHLIVDPGTAAIVVHEFAGSIDGTSVVSAFFNSFDLDPNTGDLICGTRDGRVHTIASGHVAQGVVTGVGSSSVPSNNSVNGIAELPSTMAARDISYGPGCAGNNGFTLTDVASGLPSSPNPAFGFGAYSGNAGDPVALLLSLGQQVPGIDLTAIGMPSCRMHLASIALSIGATLGGTGAGGGFVRLPVKIPANLNGDMYRQWVEVQATKTNAVGVIVSNARRMEVR